MRIIEDVKLDFSDVLIKPKRSTLTTRKDADLTRRFTFRHSKNDWTGVPIIAANMDHTGTYEMHKALRKYDMLTALCKFLEYTYQTPSDLIQTIGLDTNLDTIPESKWICLDVANGYTDYFLMLTYCFYLFCFSVSSGSLALAFGLIVCDPRQLSSIQQES